MRPIARPQRGEDKQMPGPRDSPGIDDTPNAQDEKPATSGGKPGIPSEKADATGKAREGTQPDARLNTDSREQTAGTKSLLQHRGDRLPRGHPSSPYNADGSVRPAAISLKELEAAEKADAPESGQAGAATDRAGWPEHSGDQADGADGADDGVVKDGAQRYPGCQDCGSATKSAGQRRSDRRSTGRRMRKAPGAGTAPVSTSTRRRIW